jgi:hypothetical protein
MLVTLSRPIYLQIDCGIVSYLRVPLSDIEESNFAREISKSSKRHGYWVFLDMTSDGPRFLARQFKPDVKHVNRPWPSYVQGYEEYNYNEGRPILSTDWDDETVSGDAGFR